MMSHSSSHDLSTSTEPNANEQSVILLVDDDLSSLLMAEIQLEEAGYKVVQASDGLQAIEQFHKHAPDLVIMDAMMPNMDGFEAIAAIRKTELGMYVPILMITALEDSESITRAYDVGATDFLIKPINVFILPHRVQYMLRSKQTADELRSSQSRLDNAQRIARLGHWECHIASGTVYWSQEVARMFGLDEKVLSGSMENLFERVENTQRCEVRVDFDQAVQSGVPLTLEFKLHAVQEVRAQDGKECVVRFEGEPKLDSRGICTHMLGTVQDVTNSANEQKQIRDLAFYDIVTGLPNRAQLRDNLTNALKLAERNDNQFGLLFIDLDHFKQVNDTLGHDAGDELLLQVSKRLSSVLRESDTVSRPVDGSQAAGESELVKDTIARIGGDEFVIILGDVQAAEDAARVATRIAKSVGMPYTIAETEVCVTTTIGISIYPDDGRDSETLMKHADIAMYHAKENGRNGYQFYSVSIHEHALSRFSMERELKAAIENNQLSLVYQPKFNMRTGDTSGVEVLARWYHPERGEISPDEFIPLAEESGLILALGRWVLHEATRQLKQWQDKGLGSYSVAVNCSPTQVTRGNMVSDIESALAQNPIDPALLEIELTESLFLHDIENGIQLLQNIKALGVQIALDDFGTGVSSLTYLKRLSIDKLKIDRSFIREMHVDKGDEAIVSTLVTLAHKLDLHVVAEGVENQEQLELLKAIQCDEAQGFFFSPPLCSHEFERWIGQRVNVLKRAS